jgi:hypothetical protein
MRISTNERAAGKKIELDFDQIETISELHATFAEEVRLTK